MEIGNLQGLGKVSPREQGGLFGNCRLDVLLVGLLRSGGEFIAFARKFVHEEESAEGHGVHGELNEVGALLPLGLVELAIAWQGRIFDHADPRPQRDGKDAFGARDPSAGITEKLDAAGVHAGGEDVGPALQRLQRAEIGARRN